MIISIRTGVLFSFFLCLLLIISSPMLEAQWSTSGSSIYYNSGNVGIGTSSPSQKLQVNGSLRLGDYGGMALTDGNGRISIYSSSFTNTYLQGEAASRITLHTDGIKFYTAPSGTAGNTVSWNEQMRIANNGYIGIGTTSPATRLTLKGYGWDGASMRFEYLYNSGYYSRVCEAPDGLLFRNWAATSVVFSFRNSGDTHLVDIFNDGHVNVGSPPGSGSYLLNVGGYIRANEVVVNTSGADYVFNDNYKLMKLDDLFTYIKKNKHLPDIPSANEMNEKGVKVGKIQTKLLKKIEELTLYLVQLKQENESLNSRIKVLEDKR